MLIPVDALVATVAPVIAHVNRVTAQLSAVTGLGVTTDATHVPTPTFAIIFEGHEIVGFTLSTMVTVNEHVAELPAASRTV